MKRFILAIFAIILVSVMLVLTACSGQALNYNYYWTKDGNYKIGATETLTYKVKQNNTFKCGDYDFSKRSLSTVVIDHDGDYTTVLTALSKTQLSENAKNALEGSSNLASTSNFYKISSDLNVTATYQYADGKTYTFNDSVQSECYFTDCDHRLTPLYSYKSYDTTVLSEDDKIFRFVYTTDVSYMNGKAIINVKDKTNTASSTAYDEDPIYRLAPTSDKMRTINYKEQQILDNEQLILAGRGLDFITTTTAHQVNVMDVTYLNVNGIKVTMQENVIEYITDSAVDPFVYKINGEDKAMPDSAVNGGVMQVDVDTVTFMLSDQHFTGLPFVVLYQRTQKNTTETSRTIPVKMYSAIAFLNGALEYELRSVNITE